MSTHVEPLPASRHKLVALAGNPNTGKTTLFNALTGYRCRVGNYPGVTVETRKGLIRSEDGLTPHTLLDLPGTYSLAAHSADEAIVLDALLGELSDVDVPDVIVIVIDATNPRANLFLATQILELNRPTVVALNMVDLAKKSRVHVDAEVLSQRLGCPVIPVVATKQMGLDLLCQAIDKADASPDVTVALDWPSEVTSAVEVMHGILERVANGKDRLALKAELLQTLLGDGGYHEQRWAKRCGDDFRLLLRQQRSAVVKNGDSLASIEGDVRYAWIDRLIEDTVKRDEGRPTGTARADRILTHRVMGLAILAILMGACFQSIYAWSTPIMDAVDSAIGAGGALVSAWLPAGPLQSLIVDGAIAGVGAVLVFLPQIVVLFLFLAVMEDCGYMARAAFLLDRWMGLIGLGGKSFIPLLSSFACAVPGILATRTISDRRARIITMLIAPLMSCSARLPVYMLFIGAFVPDTQFLGGAIGLQALVLLAMYLVGTIVAIVVAILVKRFLLKGDTQPFLMEMPPYRWPKVRTVFHRAYEQAREFCVSAGTIIFAVTVVVWALGYYPHAKSIAVAHDAQRQAVTAEHEVVLLEIERGGDGVATSLDEQTLEMQAKLSRIDQDEAGEYLRQSVLGRMGRWIEPVVAPLGWDWRMGTAVLASFPAREVMIATMGTIYNLGENEDEKSVGLRDKLKASRHADGRPIYNLPVALSVMVFFALCCQCGGTLAAIKRETRSWRWPIFTFVYMTTLAYIGAWLTFVIASKLYA